MPPAFLQVAIPVLYVYDAGVLPDQPPGFEMSLLPVISRALKEHANTPRVTVITGAPTAAEDLPRAFTNLGLQYGSLQKASPEAGNLLLAEFAADHFDAEAVLEHLQRIVAERQRELAEGVAAHTRRGGDEGASIDSDATAEAKPSSPPDDADAATGEDAEAEAADKEDEEAAEDLDRGAGA